MSFFCTHGIFVIVPAAIADGNSEMHNNSKISFYSEYEELRRSLDGLLVLFKVKNPVSAVFNGYTWYNIETIHEHIKDVTNGWELEEEL